MIDGKAFLKKGKEALESKRYEDAIKNLSTAEKEFPLLGDYALLWLSDAYHKIGRHEDSLKAIRALLNNYPNSPLRKKARIKEIKEAMEVSQENLQQLFESFIKDYPDETELKYTYAKWLKENNKVAQAKALFKEVYISAGPFSALAYNELSPSDITVEDMIKLSSNLIKAMDFKGAESVLRSALVKDSGSLKKEILKGLGLSLFRQKRYREAAEIYKEADEKYWQVRSLYRAGDSKAFDSALSELLKTGDKRAGSILIAVAADKRRDGKIKEAIETYEFVIDKFPSKTEDALWGIGWTLFLEGKYKKALEVFKKLYESYNDTKYLYWKARSLESLGENALDIYQTLMRKDHDFYSAMSYVRTKGFLRQPNPSPNKESLKVVKRFDRIEVLFELGLPKEVLLLELIHTSKSITSIEDFLYIGLKFQELGEYRRMVGIAKRVSCVEPLQKLCYPRAYWDTVEDLSKRYDLDPFLVLSVMREESMFDLNARSVSGAIGLMQLIPETAYRLESELRLGVNTLSRIYSPTENIHLGTYYLSTLIKEFGSYPYALAAYNAGRGVVKRWIEKGNYRSIDEFIEDIPYNETRNYVKRVLTTLFAYKHIYEAGDQKMLL